MKHELSHQLRKKVGQLFMVGFDGLEPNDHIQRLIQQYHVGGIILFRRNVHTPEQLSKLCQDLQEMNADVSDVPLLIALDQEGGMVMRVEEGVTPMPSALAFQAAGSVADCEALHRISAQEMRQLGINMMLAPVLDVNNNRLNPVIGVRAFGEEADTVIRYGMAALTGLQAEGVIATAKHFPGHGDTAVDSHLSMPIVPHDRARLDAVELPPFKAAIAQDVAAIMTAHVIFPAIEPQAGLPATLSKAVLTDLLRKELGFNGVIMSDCLEMAAIADGIGVIEGALQTLQAGADIALISHQEKRQKAALEVVWQSVEKGVISLQRIHASFERIQKLKQTIQVPKVSFNLMQVDSIALAKKVQKAAVQVQGNFRPLNLALPIKLITVEVKARSEIDEVAVGANKLVRGSMLTALQKKGANVIELVMSTEASSQEITAALAFAKDAPQIVLQTYNAVLMPGQQRLLAALAQQNLWLVAGRLPYDLDLVPDAQGRLASFGCRPAALEPVVEKLVGGAHENAAVFDPVVDIH